MVKRLAPLMLKLALSVSPVPDTKVYVWVSPESESVVESTPIVVPVATFSLIELDDNEISVGVLFELYT